MEELFRKAVARNAALRKTSVPWKPDAPHPQAWHEYDAALGRWVPAAAAVARTRGQEGKEEEEGYLPPSRLALHAWNVDMMIPHGAERMAAALEHLEREVVRFPSPPTPGSGSGCSGAAAAAANVVFLQECTASDVATVARSGWVRERFRMTETAAVGAQDAEDEDEAASANWASGFYGTLTLVDRRLPVRGCFRVHYSATGMERDVLFVDVAMSLSSSSSSSSRPLSSRAAETEGGGEGREEEEEEEEEEEAVVVVRLGNTHLESLAPDPPLRPAQVAVAAAYLPGGGGGGGDGDERQGQEQKSAGVHAGLLAGDFNAIQPFDATLHAAHGLADAYLVQRAVGAGAARDGGDGGAVGGDPASSVPPRHEGATWGQQAATVLRERFGLSRMDKIFYTAAAAAVEEGQEGGEGRREEGRGGGGGGGGLRLVRFGTFGAGVELPGPERAAEFAALGFDRPWITDHLGVVGEFDVVAG